MKNKFRHSPRLLGLALVLAGPVCLALSPGDMLAEEEIARWGELRTYDIDSSRIREIPAQYSGGHNTLLHNELGVVGISQNGIVISEAPDHVQSVIQQTLPQPMSIEHFAPTGITLARYASFAQSIEALRALKTALPDAKIGLTVRFDRPVPQ